MSQKKLLRFAQIKEFENVFEYPTDMQGRWKNYFKNDNSILLELACGRGEYAIGLANLYDNQNFIGVDVKGNRMYLGAKKALENSNTNVAFLRTQIEKITDYFKKDEVSEIWITFPDPQLRISKAKKRLTHPRFLREYLKILKQNGVVHLKTDSPNLFSFTKKVIDMYGLTLIEQCENVYANKYVKDELKIKTHYESLDIAGTNRIYYLKFSLPTIIENKDEILQQILVVENNTSP